jgi:hypothetical protein
MRPWQTLHQSKVAQQARNTTQQNAISGVTAPRCRAEPAGRPGPQAESLNRETWGRVLCPNRRIARRCSAVRPGLAPSLGDSLRASGRPGMSGQSGEDCEMSWGIPVAGRGHLAQKWTCRGDPHSAAEVSSNLTFCRIVCSAAQLPTRNCPGSARVRIGGRLTNTDFPVICTFLAGPQPGPLSD